MKPPREQDKERLARKVPLEQAPTDGSLEEITEAEEVTEIEPPAAAENEHAESAERGAGPVGGRELRIERDAAGLLVVHIAGRDERIEDARVARCFPWSSPDKHISIRTHEGKEVAIIETLGELDHKSRRVVKEELAKRIFNPRIRRVVKVKREFEVTSITAETDRGEVTFQIRSRDDVRVLSPTRALFRDVDSNTYELADLNALDPASRKHLEEYF